VKRDPPYPFYGGEFGGDLLGFLSTPFNSR
jgi:hypothetical protein